MILIERNIKELNDNNIELENKNAMKQNEINKLNNDLISKESDINKAFEESKYKNKNFDINKFKAQISLIESDTKEFERYKIIYKDKKELKEKLL